MSQYDKIKSNTAGQATLKKAMLKANQYEAHKEKCKHRMANQFCMKSNRPCPLNLFVTFTN